MANLSQIAKVLIYGGVKPRVKAHLHLMAVARARGHIRLARWIESRLQLRYGVFVSHKSVTPASLTLKHPVGIVIGEGVRLGDRVTIYQNVTVGASRVGVAGERAYPEVEDDVTIFAGAVILGGVRLGRGCVVGANSVVTHDVPAYATVAGAPARIIRQSSKQVEEVED